MSGSEICCISRLVRFIFGEPSERDQSSQKRPSVIGGQIARASKMREDSLAAKLEWIQAKECARKLGEIEAEEQKCPHCK